MFPEIEESALREYKAERSLYESYEKNHNDSIGEKKSLQSSPISFLAVGVVFAGSWYLLVATAMLLNIGNWLAPWGIVSLYISVYITHFFSEFIINAVSFGKLRKLKEKIIKVEELRKGSYSKIQPFEKMVREHAEAWLAEFFEKNLYKKRSGSSQFEEALTEFSSMLEEVSRINSILVTTHVPTREYEAYLKKRIINHNIQASTDSASLTAVRGFAKAISHIEPPKPKEVVSPEKFYKTARKINNWEEINKKRNLTGAKGEEIVFALEQEFLESIDRSDLAAKVRHASVQDGDGLGYDVLSFFEDGREKYIEVKSTTGSFASPFYLSRNELGFLKEHVDDSFIYRVTISDDSPQIKASMSAEVLEMSEVTPISYIVRRK